MTTNLLPLSVFLGVSLVMAGLFWLLNRRGDRVQARLRELSGESSQQPVVLSPARKQEMPWPSLDAALLPVNAEQRTRLENRLYQAGIYHPLALRLFIAGKLGLLVVGWVMALSLYLTGTVSLLAACTIATGWSAASFLGPGLWLDQRKARHQAQLRRGLPDMLDILVLCLEGGLSVHAGSQRLAQELHAVHPQLDAELTIVRWEIQLGHALSASLLNMAQRCEVEEVRALASMLGQSERYGVGLTKTLRIHAEAMRFKAIQAAETQAQSAAVKILFPTLLFIFPGVFIILLGPAVLQMKTVLDRMKPRDNVKQVNTSLTP